jgi:hypothetical protein
VAKPFCKGLSVSRLAVSPLASLGHSLLHRQPRLFSGSAASCAEHSAVGKMTLSKSDVIGRGRDIPA